jgi:hypothetical protein
MNKFKNAFAAALVAVGALCAGSAQASDVRWSVGVHLPLPVPVVVAPAYYPPPVYAPRHVHAYPAPRMYYPAPVRYDPPSYHHGRVVHGGRWDRDRWDGRHGSHGGNHQGHRGHDRDHDRDDHRGHDRGDRGDRDHGARGGRH